MDACSGMAGRVRRSQESDDFDLAGYTKDQCISFAKGAFTDAFPITHMVRLTFTVGGGKLCRAKYSDVLPKDFCNALAAIGFDEDSAASCEVGSAGRYKYQHDTSKNLKFVHVFPRIQEVEAGEEEEQNQPKKLSDPLDVLAQSEMDNFKRLVATHLDSYALKQRLRNDLKDRLANFKSIEAKLVACAQITDEEQEVYDNYSAENFTSKITLLNEELKNIVNEGQLTAAEKTDVLGQLDSNLERLETELQRAEREGKVKMVSKFQDQREEIKKTRTNVKEAEPVSPPDLRYGAEIRKFRLKLQRLAKLEKECNGKYSLDQLKQLGEKPELEEGLEVVEKRSRMWLETDEKFQHRVQILMSRPAPSAPKKTPVSNAGNNGGWSTMPTKNRGGRR